MPHKALINPIGSCVINIVHKSIVGVECSGPSTLTLLRCYLLRKGNDILLTAGEPVIQGTACGQHIFMSTHTVLYNYLQNPRPPAQIHALEGSSQPTPIGAFWGWAGWGRSCGWLAGQHRP